MAIYFRKIKFDSLEVVLRLFRKENRPLVEVLSYFDNPALRAQIESVWPALQPMHIREVLQLPNAEQRMIGMSVFPHEEIITGLDAVLVDEQTVHKQQVRWDAQLQPYVRQFDDTYSLYVIPARNLGAGTNQGGPFVPPVYVVKCKCASTDRIYYQYVPHWIGEGKDAIAAIAWTFRINEQHLTKEQYLHCLYSET
jgi:hypothetical protein